MSEKFTIVVSVLGALVVCLALAFATTLFVDDEQPEAQMSASKISTVVLIKSTDTPTVTITPMKAPTARPPTSTPIPVETRTLDLKVDNLDDSSVIHIVIDDVEPGDIENQYWTLKNIGSICGQPSIEFSNIVNYENGCTESEGVLDSNCGNPGVGEGELGGILYVQLKWKQTTWNLIPLVLWGDPKINGLTGPYGLGENGGAPIPVLCENEEVQIQFYPWWDGKYSMPADNDAQSDSVEFDVVFHLD